MLLFFSYTSIDNAIVTRVQYYRTTLYKSTKYSCGMSFTGSVTHTGHGSGTILIAVDNQKRELDPESA